MIARNSNTADSASKIFFDLSHEHLHPPPFLGCIDSPRPLRRVARSYTSHQTIQHGVIRSRYHTVVSCQAGKRSVQPSGPEDVVKPSAPSPPRLHHHDRNRRRHEPTPGTSHVRSKLLAFPSSCPPSDLAPRAQPVCGTTRRLLRARSLHTPTDRAPLIRSARARSSMRARS